MGKPTTHKHWKTKTQQTWENQKQTKILASNIWVTNKKELYSILFVS